MKETISSTKRILATESSGYDKETIANMKAQMETYEIALKYNVNMLYYYNGNYWKVALLSEIQNAKVELALNEGIQTEEKKSELEKVVNDRIKLLEKDDYSGYIEFLEQVEKTKLNNKEISKEEYDDQMYLLELRSKYNIYKEDKVMYTWQENVYQDIQNIKSTLRTGINQSTGKLLNIEEVEKLQDNLKIAEYRLENDIPMLESGSSGRSLFDMFAPSFSMVFVAILMIMIMGSAISTEISKGTIKFLLFTPNKRWKILLSKLLSAMIILLVLTLLLSVLSVIIGNIFFKEPGTTYVYVQNGEAKVLSNFVYTVLYFLASDIDILVYMLFALMLSTVTRNTALTVGVSIACYIGSGLIMQIINQFVTADWIKFIPFNNLGLVDRIFANNISFTTMQSASSFLSGVSIGFSLCVLGVCAILMIVTMFDSFNKRDIVQ